MLHVIDEQLGIIEFLLFRNIYQSEFNSFHFADFSKLIIKSREYQASDTPIVVVRLEFDGKTEVRNSGMP